MERLFIKRTEGYYESAGKKNFSGLFWFEDFDGKFIRGIQYIDGKVAKSIKDEKISNGRTTSSCNTLYVTIDYYYTTYAGGMWHGPTYSYSEVVSYLVCEEDTDPQGIEIIGGGSGGSGGSTGTSTYVMHPATDYQVFDDLCAGLNAMLALQNSVGVEINGVRTTNGKLIILPYAGNGPTWSYFSTFYANVANRSVSIYQESGELKIQLSHPLAFQLPESTAVPNDFIIYTVAEMIHTHADNNIPSSADSSYVASYPSHIIHSNLTSAKGLTRFNANGIVSGVTIHCQN
jgi:hypothetical protein